MHSHSKLAEAKFLIKLPNQKHLIHNFWERKKLYTLFVKDWLNKNIGVSVSLKLLPKYLIHIQLSSQFITTIWINIIYQ